MNIRNPRTRKNLHLLVFFLMVDILFLRWIWVHFQNWGFWDWDYQQALLEASRQSIVRYHQLPLWNPFIGGGTSLAGDTLNHVWGPSFLPILLFGTIAGIKLDIFLYLGIAEFGIFLLARNRGLGDEAACLAALLFSVGGVFAHRLTHGHFEWIAIAWMPYIVLCLDKSAKAFNWKFVSLASLAFAFLFVDGGPYQFAFFAIFIVAYAGIYTIQMRNGNIFKTLIVSFTVGFFLAAIKVFPMLETVTRYPRITSEFNFYNAPFTPTAFQLLTQSFLSHAQYHRPEAWMPYILNVGCYLGWIPILLAGGAALFRPRRNGLLIILGALFLWLTLGPAAPIDLWHILHQFPGFSGLRVPSRFNVFVLLVVALLAGEGLQLLAKKTAPIKLLRFLPICLIAFVTIDLISVNGRIFKVAFSVPPTILQWHEEFGDYSTSPHLSYYRSREFYRISPHWQSGVFPAILENRGVLHTLQTIPFPNSALPFDAPSYRGEVWVEDGAAAILQSHISPSRIRVHTDGAGGILLFNVNYDPGWLIRGAPKLQLFHKNGLLAASLPKGAEDIEVIYRPRSFIAGAWASLLTLAVGAGTAILASAKGKS